MIAGELARQIVHSGTKVVFAMKAMVPTIHEALNTSKEATEQVKVSVTLHIHCKVKPSKLDSLYTWPMIPNLHIPIHSYNSVVPIRLVHVVHSRNNLVLSYFPR